MKKIYLNEKVAIDLDNLIETRLLVQANSGAGKSWAIRRIIEQAHGKVQIIVLDPEGEFSTLREKYDFILAGKEGDTPADPRSGALLAEKLLQHNVSAIIDLYELPPQERKHFVKLFLDAMVNADKKLWHPCLVIIDEAHIFCPEKGEAESAGAVIDMATRGRKRDFAVILATQRISKLNKDAAAECNNKLIGRSGLDIDMKRAADELGFTSREEMLSLRKLKAGEFYAFGPSITQEVEKIQIGGVETTHKMTRQQKIKTIPPTDKIKALLPQFSDLPAEAKKKEITILDMQTQIRNLTQENATLKRQPKVTDSKEIEKVVKEALGKVEQERFIERGEWQKQIENWFVILKGISEASSKAMEDYKKPKKVDNQFYVLPPAKVYELQKIAINKDKLSAKFDIGQEIAANDDTTLTGPEQKILDAIAWLHAIRIAEPEQTAVAFLAGYTFGGGAFNNPRGSLRVKGLVEYRGTKIILTPPGFIAANQPEESLTTEILHKKVLDILPGPERKLLEPLLAAYPNSLTYEDLAAQAGYAPNGGAFNNPKGRLKSLGLVEYVGKGLIKARDILFI